MFQSTDYKGQFNQSLTRSEPRVTEVKPNVLDTISSRQLPILEKIDLYIWMKLFRGSKLKYRLTVPRTKKQEVFPIAH